MGNFIRLHFLEILYDSFPGHLRHWPKSTAAIQFYERQNAIDAVHEMELPQWISVNAVNDLESRMQNEIAVIELDQPQQNWIRRV